jgi:uncharacterized protein (TIGR03382 family)
LYLTGADACVAGVTGAMMGGVLAASLLLRRNLMFALMRGNQILPTPTAGDATRRAQKHDELSNPPTLRDVN